MAFTKAQLEAANNSELANGLPIQAADHRSVNQKIIDELFDAQSRADIFSSLDSLESPLENDQLFVIRSGQAYLISTSILDFVQQFEDLSDVNVALKQDGDILKYDAATEKWIASTLGDLGIASVSIVDAEVELPATGNPDILYVLRTGSNRFAIWDGSDYELISLVNSITGDGVDNTDPFNPVLTFPTPAEIGAEPELGFTPEDVSNKSTDGTFSSADNTTYPTTQAVKTYVDNATPTIDDASETVKGIVELVNQTEAETVNGTVGTLDHVRAMTLRAWRWSWDKMLTVAQTFADLTATSFKLPSQIQSGKNVAVYIRSSDGELIKVPFFEYDLTNQKVTITGVDNLMSSSSFDVKNSDGFKIIEVLNGLRVRFNGPSAVWEVNDDVTSDNASIVLNDNQAKALKLVNKNGDELAVVRTTTGSLSVIFRESVEYDYKKGFKKVHVQTFTITTTTASDWNNLFSLSLMADTSVTVKVNHLHAYATDRSVAFAYGNKDGYARRDNSNVTNGTNPSYTIQGDGITGVAWRILPNNTTDTIDIDFQNNSGTGKTWHVALDLTYIVRNLPT